MGSVSVGLAVLTEHWLHLVTSWHCNESKETCVGVCVFPTTFAQGTYTYYVITLGGAHLMTMIYAAP